MTLNKKTERLREDGCAKLDNFRKSSNSSDLVAPPFPNKEDIDLVHNHVILAPAVEAGQGVLFGVETHLRLGLNKRQKY